MAPPWARQGAKLLQRTLPFRHSQIPLRTISTSLRNDSSPRSARRSTSLQTASTRQLATAAELTSQTALQQSTPAGQVLTDESKIPEDYVRLPRTVQAVYLRPLRRKAKHGLPACDLQLRSYSVRNIEFFADFALRAAYYLNMPASGPVPLPKMIQRWTVSKSPFVHKKSKENFERITLRRLIQVKDAHPETVQIWLAYLRKHAYHGVGIKANIWEHAPIEVGKTLDVTSKEMKEALDTEWANFGRRKSVDPTEKVIAELRTEQAP